MLVKERFILVDCFVTQLQPTQKVSGSPGTLEPAAVDLFIIVVIVI